MYIQVTEHTFIDAFMAIRPDNFTYEALRALYEWHEDLESETGESIELDVIAICCEWSESDIEDVRADYNLDIEDYPEDDDVMQYLQDHTVVTGLDNGNYLYMQF